MSWALHWLEAGGTLAPWRDAIARDLRRTEALIRAQLDLGSADIVVHRVRGMVVDELGVDARRIGPGGIVIMVDPDNVGFPGALEAGWIGRLLAHEAHHTVRDREVGYGMTLAEALVSEGLADAFDEEISGQPPAPWSVALDASQLASARARAELIWHEPRFDFGAWFHGETREIPRWAGYALARDIVRPYLAAHPGATAASLVAAPACRILGRTD